MTSQAPVEDDFFSPLGLDRPFLKLAAEGFAGSGKTYTLAQIAIGLHRKLVYTKPVVMFDTEESGGHLATLFFEAGVPVVVRRSRSMADLKETMRRCRDGASEILLIDSISHVWENFLQKYQESRRKQRLEFQDWGIIKPTWKREFSEPLVRDRYHILMTGRVGFEYDNEVDEDGKRQIYKSGVKMRVEGETAYEPDMLILMERQEEVLAKEKRVWREATILKDRSTVIDGKTFQNPTFKDFEPALDRMLRLAVDLKQPAERDASELFSNEENRRDFTKRRDIALEKIEAALVEAFPGQAAEAKRTKVQALRETFGTTSWTEIKGLHPDALEASLDTLDKWIASKREQAEAAQ